MKYLRKFKMYESIDKPIDEDDIIENLYEICLDLKDLGYLIDIDCDIKGDWFLIGISEGKRDSWWSDDESISDIEKNTMSEVREHCILYMSSIGFKKFRHTSGLIDSNYEDRWTFYK